MVESTWIDLVGDELQTKDGVQPTTKVLSEKKLVGFYFSAHWCPPCRTFTPLLNQTYEELKEEHPELELVFVSFNRDQGAFDEYYGEMPFAALPYVDRDQQKALKTKFGMFGVPMLIFANDKGDVVTKDGRDIVEEAAGDLEKLWTALSVQT